MQRQASLPEAIIILLIIITMLSLGILAYGAPPHLPILLAAIVVALYATFIKIPFSTLEKHIVTSVGYGIIPMLIMLMIGILIGLWLLGGTVQTITFYGLQVLSPTYFLATTVIITAIVALMTGSSLSAIGTIGVSLMGISIGMGADPAMTAGAIVSGAIFGDKLSPLSDTTNLAAATAKVDLFEHIRHMLWTTIPALIITVIIFLFIGYNQNVSGGSLNDVNELLVVLDQEFSIHLITVLSPLVIIILAAMKVRPLPALAAGMFVAIATAFYNVPGLQINALLGAMFSGYDANTGHVAIDELLSLGGLEAMLFGVSLIIIALSFGGLIQATGITEALIRGIQSVLKSRGNTIASTLASCFGINFVTGEQYLSILLPGQMYEDAYKKHNLHPKNLSRTLEDGGTILHPLIPWGIIGAFVMTTLNVDFTYVFYTFLSIVTPFIALLYAYTGWTLTTRKVES
ncbi:Na+/H+ antiporter NhaC [Geomicrobium sediminis]|uniref:NhaC family Na+:H+ antiporter n=1 Tax=Geomicrobium sediminis TaxID=1347788 RepID=A0ABS2PCB1_9BACL|nr:Na+/H+ antiporter NhaC [Geomicrobium sediminis]MBM7632746.1 NhaC family Na+:H+ antiporter [Geomicrobium sediminis]